MQTVSIVIPAHNEAKRITRTLEAYVCYAIAHKSYTIELLVVLNGCIDNTLDVVRAIQKKYPDRIRIIDLKESGKGLAIKAGFLDALTRNNQLIGFLDADMATKPIYFDDLLTKIDGYDGIIASRYMSDSKVYPPRPYIKEWGRMLVYNNLIYLLFGLPYVDLQCGAKIFKRDVIAVVAPLLTITQWAFDVELLYLCKRNGFCIKEIPTVWYDQDDSKLRIMHSGLRMLWSVIKLRIAYSFLRCLLK